MKLYNQILNRYKILIGFIRNIGEPLKELLEQSELSIIIRRDSFQ